MFEFNLTTVLILVLLVVVYGIDKLVTWRLTQKGIEAAERQIPVEGIGKLFEGFSKLPAVQAGYTGVVTELKEVAATTANPWDDRAIEWFDVTTGKRWFREDAMADDLPTFKRVKPDSFSEDTTPATVPDEPRGPYSAGL